MRTQGFPKELYEVMWEYLCQTLESSGIQVRGIWIADVAHQGVSGHLNADRLGNSPSWNDSARDLLLVVNHFRKEMPRPVIGIGHSLGACVLACLSLMHPRLIAGALVLIDPVVLSKPRSQLTEANEEIEASNPVLSLVRLSATRRDQWRSREEAALAFRKSKFYKTWDERVLDLWLQHGLRSISVQESSGGDGPVTLSTSRDQEVFTFLLPKFDRFPVPDESEGSTYGIEKLHLDPKIVDDFPFYRPEPPAVFEQLPHLRPPTLYVFADQSTLSDPSSCRERVERTGTGVGGSGGAKKGKVKECVMENAGHLVPFERPRETAEAIAPFLVESLTTWQREEDEWNTWWKARSREDRTQITERWKREIGMTARPIEGSKGKL